MARSAMKDLTVGSPMKLVFGFAVPLLFGFLFQQMYNFVDTAIVGRFLGSAALAAVGSAFSLMVLLTSLLLGLCMGSSVYFSIQYGRQDPDRLRNGIFQSFLLIGSRP